MSNHVSTYNCIFLGCKTCGYFGPRRNKREEEMNIPTKGNETNTEDFVMNELNKTFKLEPKAYVNVCMSLGGAQTKFNQALELLERARFCLDDRFNLKDDIEKFLKDFEIEELKNFPTEFDKLPYETICLVEHLGYGGTRLVVKLKNNHVRVVDGRLSNQWPSALYNTIEKELFNDNYNFIKVVDLS